MLSRRRFVLSGAVAAPALALDAQKRGSQSSPAPACAEEGLPTPILALTDRRKEIVPITVSERNSRLDRARDLMTANKIDAIVITTGASLVYYTGAHWGQSERLFAYVLPRAAAPFLICPAFERDRAAELLANFPERESTLSYFWQENESPFDLVRRGLGESAVKTGNLGIEEHTQFEFSYAIAFGVRLEDDMHITENGAELFTPQSDSLEEPFAVQSR